MAGDTTASTSGRGRRLKIGRRAPDTGRVMRLVALAALLACLAASSALAAPRKGSVVVPASWAQAQIEQVARAGLLGGDARAFRPDDPVTAGELVDALRALGLRATAPADPSAPLTMRQLDARLVGAVGLQAAARRLRLGVRDAGLRPPAWLGTETIARLAGFRVNHPFGQDEIERSVGDLATRAEAAYSLARVVAAGDTGSFAWLDDLSRAFSLPALGGWQRTVLTRAVQFVGLPYVWTGTSERPQLQWTADGAVQVTVPGGFDCSGLVWRVYRTKAFPGAPATLATVLEGRTTYAMSGEVPRAKRIPLTRIRPGDVLFFGDRGAVSKPRQVGHAGIYLGNGWFVHSSGAGVTLQPLQGWYLTTFAWARRPLAEAGIAV